MLSPEVLKKLDAIESRFEELTHQLSDPGVVSSGERYRKVAKERASVEAAVTSLRAYRKLLADIADNEAFLAEKDPELRELAKEELAALRPRVSPAEEELKRLLVPKDPNDEKDVILEIRAGAGGDEAGLFAAEVLRLYLRYAERRGWRCEVLDTSPGPLGVVKDVTVTISGDAVYSSLKYESGVHRVQRVPATEAQGRIHTSTVTVAVLPEAQEVDVELKPEELEISVCRASGPGGQGVNTTDSAVQIIHRPSGLIVRCSDGRSQQKNKQQAFTVLRSRLLEQKVAEENAKYAAQRKAQVGTGERNERIRTYNFPQNRVTDHRIELTLYNLPAVIDGDIDGLIEPLMAHDLEERLAAFMH